MDQITNFIFAGGFSFDSTASETISLMKNSYVELNLSAAPENLVAPSAVFLTLDVSKGRSSSYIICPIFSAAKFSFTERLDIG
jgi:hypothetical protein